MGKNRGNATEIMDSFRRIVRALRSSHRAAGDLDLTGAQLFVLATLGTAVGPMGVKELAERTRTDQSTVSVVVGRLVDRGLVKRVRSTSIRGESSFRSPRAAWRSSGRLRRPSRRRNSPTPSVNWRPPMRRRSPGF